MNANDLQGIQVEINKVGTTTELGEQVAIWHAEIKYNPVKCDQNHNHWQYVTIRHQDLDELIKQVKDKLNEIHGS